MAAKRRKPHATTHTAGGGRRSVGAVVFGAGLTGAWMGGVVYVAVLGYALHWRFQSGAWQTARI